MSTKTKEQIKALQTQNDCLTLALSDLAKDETKWFGRRAPEGFALGVSRPRSACGGILAVWQGGCVSSWVDYKHPRQDKTASLWSLMQPDRTNGDPVTGAEAATLYLAAHDELGQEGDYLAHCRLRLAYETQMLEAAGGRAGVVEMEVGGRWLGGTIAKVNKSSVTGRVSSVAVIVPAVTDWTYRVENVPGTSYALAQFDTERAAPETYQPPTDESRAKLAEFEAAKKAAADKRKAEIPACPLVNPTDEDAERLQAIWNAQVIAKGERRKRENRFSTYCPELEGEQSKVLRITQAQYSAASGGTYSRAETVPVQPGGITEHGWSRYSRQHAGRAVAKVRVASGENYKAERVIILTDKPQKPLPAAVWVAVPVPAEVAAT